MFHLHKFVTIHDTDKHKYQECKCGKRRVKVVYSSGYQPINKTWLENK